MTTRRALVVDDEEDWRQTFVDLLSNLGLEVDAVDGIVPARALLAANRYALLVMDMVLSPAGMTLPTQAFLEYVRRTYPTLPVVATTGQLIPYRHVYTLPQLGVVDFWPKQELSVPELYERAERVIASATLPPSPTVAGPVDAFVSYSRANSSWVYGVFVPRLESTGLRLCVDVRDFAPGAHSLTEMERAVRESRRTVLVLTPDYVRSEWTQFENVLAGSLDPAARNRRVVPVLRAACSMPLWISALAYVDLTPQADADAQFARLVAVLQAP